MIEEFNDADFDSCDMEELVALFGNQYVAVKRKKLTSDDVECSRFLASNNAKCLAVVLSDKSVCVIDENTLQVSIKCTAHQQEITGITFSPINSDMLYSSSSDGSIKVWDIRSNACARTICFNSPKYKKPLTAFDLSSDDRVICAGTELIGEDSFLLFWDLRGDNLLGGYWNSHSDDISYIKFHPFIANLVASSALDGLVNIFDINKSAEEKALLYCLNNEDNVNLINWCPSTDKKKKLLAFTDVHSIQFWNIEESSPVCKFSRSDITKALQRNVIYECYTIPTKNPCLEINPIVLCGSGLEHGSGCLRTLRLNEKLGILEAHGLLENEDEGKISSITQAALFSVEHDLLFTVTEDANFFVWKNLGSACISKRKSLKDYILKEVKKIKYDIV